ncbi:hypothetical protein [uncultured Aureimonas sp.]|uniref:hypothetical protein n=1 Tax=uncultured Aureimonas sp. TaxID=1604662 RepID=UPI0025D68C0C|nr:hypothetical protein [uncultured Aureimonas sp.]
MTAHVPKAFDVSASLGFGQEIDLAIGDVFVRGRQWDKARVTCRVEAIVPGDRNHARVIVLAEMRNGGEKFYETDASLEMLAGNGEFRPLSMDPMTAPGRGRRSALRVEPSGEWTWEESKGWWARHVFDHPDFAGSQPAVRRVMKVLEDVPAGIHDMSASTVLRAIGENRANNWCDPVATAMPRSTVVHQPSQFGAIIERAMQRSLFVALRIKGNSTHALSILCRWARRVGLDPSSLPCLRTVERRMGRIPPYVRDYIRLGPEIAARRHGSKIKRLLPDCPLHTAEVDDLRLDCEVCDDVSLVPLGRPWLIMIRDRRTGVILGFSLAIGAPSFESFVEALRHAWLPKDMSAYPGLSWRYHGKFLFLVVDRASHFVGFGMEVAGKHAGYDVIELAPASPELKGGLESTNGYVNDQFSHVLPGSVGGNVAERAENEPTRLPPMLKLSELRFLVTHFICTNMNEMPKANIGPVPGMKGVPGAIWNREVGKIPRRPLPMPEIFDRLAGNRKSLTIQRGGITFDYITYWSPLLDEITLSGHHRQGDRYECLRPRSTLEYIWVFADFVDAPIKVPVCSADAGYATGLSADLHDILKARARVEVNEEKASRLLQMERDAASRLAAEIRRDRERLDIPGIIERIKRGDERKRLVSKVTVGTHSPEASAELLDFSNPPVVPENEALSPNASPIHRTPAPGRGDSVRKYERREGRVQEIDRGRVPAEAAAGHGPPSDDELEAEMARLAELKRERGWAK